MRDRLAPLLDAGFTKSQLVHMLVPVADEQPLKAPVPTGQILREEVYYFVRMIR